MNSILRWIGVAVAVGLLVVVCSGHEHAGHKGLADPLPSIFSTITVAAIATLLVRIFFKTTAGKIAAPFVGGIAGVFGIAAIDSPGHFAGPYGGIVGLLVGIIVVLIPMPHVSRPTSSST